MGWAMFRGRALSGTGKSYAETDKQFLELFPGEAGSAEGLAR